MKRLSLGTVLILCFITFAPAASASEQKIATFNMHKAFDSYYKGVLLTASLQEEAAKADRELAELVATGQKHETELNELKSDANDQAVSAETRETIKKTADTKAAELESDKRVVEEFYRAAQARLSERRQLRSNDIRKEINTVVGVRAKAAGYSLVLDISVSNSPNSLVLFSDGRDDLTDSIIKELNAAAPATPAPGAMASSTVTNTSAGSPAK
jgi:Skp family chaperone for outer membrane proteins